MASFGLLYIFPFSQTIGNKCSVRITKFAFVSPYLNRELLTVFNRENHSDASHSYYWMATKQNIGSSKNVKLRGM